MSRDIPPLIFILLDCAVSACPHPPPLSQASDATFPVLMNNSLAREMCSCAEVVVIEKVTIIIHDSYSVTSPLPIYLYCKYAMVCDALFSCGVDDNS